MLEEVQTIFEEGDPELRSWFLISNGYVPFVLCCMYILVIKYIGPAFMKNREPYRLRTVMIVYNLIITAIYAYSVCRSSYLLYYILQEKSICGTIRIRKSDATYQISCYAWYAYVVKYVEFLDTIFFVMRKRYDLVTNLHVIHHSTLPLFGWMLARSETGVFQSFPILINSIVHIFMYAYYALAAMGPRFRKYIWWKRYLTILQMAQFVIILLLQVVGVVWGGCGLSKVTFYINCFIAILFFVLFCNYYIHSFKPKTVEEKKQT